MSTAENPTFTVEVKYTPSLLRLKRNLFEALIEPENEVKIQKAVNSILAKTDFENGAVIIANTAAEAIQAKQDELK